ncbi:MAG: hypothetical protein AB1593_05995 [Pseudomonadota bacterium]
MRTMETGLAPLTAEEIAFLSAPLQAADDFPERLRRALAATLSARLRVRVAIEACAAACGASEENPIWHADDRLAMLWLARRLGGQHGHGRVPFVPKGLIRMLDAVLAERWLDRPGSLPAAQAWRLTVGASEATLSLALPRSPNDMTRWAREAITR